MGQEQGTTGRGDEDGDSAAADEPTGMGPEATVETSPVSGVSDWARGATAQSASAASAVHGGGEGDHPASEQEGPTHAGLAAVGRGSSSAAGLAASRHSHLISLRRTEAGRPRHRL